jgi:hypothetical protein
MQTLKAPTVAPYLPSRHIHLDRQRPAADMVKAALSFTNDPARRFRALWYLVAWCCALAIGIIGGGYALDGSRANRVGAQTALRLILNIEPGGLRTHGFIMVGISVLLIYGLNDYRRTTRLALMLLCFYSLATAMLIFGSWWAYGDITWGAPWWYLLVAVLATGLLVLAPPLNRDGRRFEGFTEGSGRA